MKALKIYLCFLIVFHVPVRVDSATGFPVSLEKLYEQVKSGDSYAQALLGICLRSGEFGLKVDKELARKWTLHAINSDEPLGYYNQANISMVAGNYEKATQVYEFGAEAGNAHCQYQLGIIHYRGRGVELDYAKALPWFKKAVAQDHAASLNILGVMYVRGQGVPSSFRRARQLYERSG